MGIKLSESVNADGSHHAWMFACPGCKSWHVVDQRWTFNGDQEKPTFSPSILCSSNYGDPPKKSVCHSFVTDGMIRFLDDCTHELAGKTVEIPDWSDGREAFGP